MAKYEIESWTLLLCILLFLVGMYMLSSCSLNCENNNSRDGFLRFGGPPYTSSCEFQPACLWDTARQIQLSNGMQGNCTLHGIACPSFSTDHDRARNVGLSPTMVSDNYMDRLIRSRGGNPKKERYGGGGGDYVEDGGGDYITEGYGGGGGDYVEDGGGDYITEGYSGEETVLSLGMYPTNQG